MTLLNTLSPVVVTVDPHGHIEAHEVRHLTTADGVLWFVNVSDRIDDEHREGIDYAIDEGYTDGEIPAWWGGVLSTALTWRVVGELDPANARSVED